MCPSSIIVKDLRQTNGTKSILGHTATQVEISVPHPVGKFFVMEVCKP